MAPPKKTYEEQLGESLAVMARTRDGLFVLRHLLELTGYHKGLLRFNRTSNEINVQAALHNVALRDVWHGLRSKMDYETITLVERVEPAPKSKAKKETEQQENDDDA